MNDDVVLDIREISKTYGEKTAVRGVELCVRPGEVVGLIGPNGAGKTTLIECAIGITKPTSGYAKIMGFDTWTQHAAAARHYGVQFQTTELAPFTRVSDTFWLFQKAFAKNDDPRRLCAEFGLHENRYRAPFRTLSGGEKKRVLIALAFLGNPMIVLLDEPTAGMDPSARSQFWDSVRWRRDAGRSIVCSSHDLEDMEVNCDRVAFLADGAMRACGTAVDIIGDFGAYTTYVIAAVNPPRLLHDLRSQTGDLDGVVWVGQVQGRVLIIASDRLVESNLTKILNPEAVRHQISRRSTLEDTYHLCVSTSETPEDYDEARRQSY